MPPEAHRVAPLRHSRKSALFAVVLTLAAIYLSYDFFWPWMLPEVLALLLLVAAAVFLYRYRVVVAALPKPLGRGKVSVLGADRVGTQGLLIVALGVSTLFVPFIALFFLPPVAVVAFILALMGGLAASEVVYFMWITRLQRRTKATVLSLTEFREEKGRQLLFKSLELAPWEGRKRTAGSAP